MGTDKAIFAEVLWGATGNKRDRKWRDQKWRQSHDQTWHQSRTLSGSMFCACATGSGAISALVGPFDRKWRQSRDWKRPCPEVALIGSRLCSCATRSWTISTLVGPLTGSDKVTWPEVALTGSRFCACPAFSPRFFLSSSTMVTEGQLTPFGVPLDVRMRNRKLRNTRNDRKSRDPFGSVLGVFSTTSASYNHRKPHVLYLAWWLELALVICPFYFHIVSI
jgi:hypothetical protein